VAPSIGTASECAGTAGRRQTRHVNCPPAGAVQTSVSSVEACACEKIGFREAGRT
jgi:hypothetical protein